VVLTLDLAQGIARYPNVAVLVDALGEQHPQTIAGAVRIPEAGKDGTFDDSTQDDLAQRLENLTGANFDRPVIFFCQGALCWESYNASLRAINLGYTHVFWYRGGLAAWKEAGLPLQP
jgi:PQQ-dependent catabolism-associated CXXCW motif protein